MPPRAGEIFFKGEQRGRQATRRKYKKLTVVLLTL
jgi:hypothetical protein